MQSSMDDIGFSVRELVQGDVTLVADYWSEADPDYLIGLGVDRASFRHGAISSRCSPSSSSYR